MVFISNLTTRPSVKCSTPSLGDITISTPTDIDFERAKSAAGGRLSEAQISKLVVLSSLDNNSAYFATNPMTLSKDQLTLLSANPHAEDSPQYFQAILGIMGELLRSAELATAENSHRSLGVRDGYAAVAGTTGLKWQNTLFLLGGTSSLPVHFPQPDYVALAGA